jgi:DNA invertase Pin-like site-specific DNA recombinase
MMIIGYARVSTTEQNLGLEHDDLKPALDASVDQTDARNGDIGFGDRPSQRLRQPTTRKC